MTAEESKRLDEAIIAGLSVPAEDRCWVAVNLALDYYYETEIESSLNYSLQRDQRISFSDRAGGLADFKKFLAAKFEAARKS